MFNILILIILIITALFIVYAKKTIKNLHAKYDDNSILTGFIFIIIGSFIAGLSILYFFIHLMYPELFNSIIDGLVPFAILLFISVGFLLGGHFTLKKIKDKYEDSEEDVNYGIIYSVIASFFVGIMITYTFYYLYFREIKNRLEAEIIFL